MRSSMTAQATRRGEASPTINTLVRLLSSVGPLMLGQGALLRETLPANITFIRLLSCVGPLMPDHVSLL